MEQEIKQTSKQLKYLYIAFWFIAIAAVVLCEVFDEWGGKYAENDKAIYLGETILILLTIICIPFSLKYYARMLTNKIDKLGIADAIKERCKQRFDLDLNVFLVDMEGNYLNDNMESIELENIDFIPNEYFLHFLR